MKSAPLIAAMAEEFETPHGRERVADRLTAVMIDHLVRLLGAGWGPDDLVRAVRRRKGVATASAIAGPLDEAMGRLDPNCKKRPEGNQFEADGDARPFDPTHPGWQDHLAALVDALGVVEQLPALPDVSSVSPTGRKAHSDGEERMLVRIRALLAKAESTEYVDEAEAFVAKAQLLMTHHCIDRALLDEGSDPHCAPQVEARRIWLEDPYLRAKSLLLAEVAEANRCRSVVSVQLGFSTVVGFAADLDATQLIFTSLLVQATRGLTALSDEPTQGQRTRRPAYRRSFLVAYAKCIGARLREANRVASAEADETLERRWLPVLARREEQVDTAIRSLFGTLSSIGHSVSDLAGWTAGSAAANLADLGLGRSLPNVDAS